MAAWQARDWPGNVRELRHLADRWVLGLEDTATEAADRDAPEARLAMARPRRRGPVWRPSWRPSSAG
jgi:two-component system C4-dicarboxylate transport response regulator DctD